MRYLQLGDTGRDVEVWQRFLMAQNLLDPGDIRFGEFNDATLDATTKFQTNYRLSITGVCDTETREAAADRGLEIVDNQVPGGAPMGQWILIGCAVALVLGLGTCVLDPPVGKEFNHRPLPLPATQVPDSAPRKSCPGWFC